MKCYTNRYINFLIRYYPIFIPFVSRLRFKTNEELMKNKEEFS